MKVTAPEPSETPTSSWRGALSLSKDILPWAMLIANLLYGFAIKQSTSDRTRSRLYLLIYCRPSLSVHDHFSA